MNTYSLTLTIEQINDLLEILWLAGHQREKLPAYDKQIDDLRKLVKIAKLTEQP
jgi:hypothetical protein